MNVRAHKLLLIMLLAFSSCSAPKVTPTLNDNPNSVKNPPISIEVGPPKPINAVVMPSTMGHCWHKTPQKDRELVWVHFDVKSFIPEPIVVDRAVIEVAGQKEEVDLNLQLSYREYKDYIIEVKFIRGIPNGGYDLKLSLWSGEKLLISRTDRVELK